MKRISIRCRLSRKTHTRRHRAQRGRTTNVYLFPFFLQLSPALCNHLFPHLGDQHTRTLCKPIHRNLRVSTRHIWLLNQTRLPQETMTTHKHRRVHNSQPTSPLDSKVRVNHSPARITCGHRRRSHSMQQRRCHASDIRIQLPIRRCIRCRKHRPKHRVLEYPRRVHPPRTPYRLPHDRDINVLRQHTKIDGWVVKRVRALQSNRSTCTWFRN